MGSPRVERCLACEADGVATRGALPRLRGRWGATRGAHLACEADGVATRGARLACEADGKQR
jgi:hypothetical protein